MALSQSALLEMFQAPPVITEPEAILNMSNGWRGYLSGATVAGVPANSTALEPAIVAFAASLVGMSAPGAGLAKLVSAMTTSWGVLTLAAQAVFAGAPVVAPGSPPPALGSALAALAPVLVANLAQKKSLADASDAIASVLHPLNLGAVVTGALAPLPIL